MRVTDSYIKDFITDSFVAYTPRVLCGVATAVSILALLILICSPTPTIALQISCLNVSMYAAISAGALLVIGLIRDAVSGIFILFETDQWKKGAEEFIKNAGLTLLAPIAATCLIIFALGKS